LTATPRPSAVAPSSVRWTKPRRGADWGRGPVLSSGRAESGESTPCPAESVWSALADFTRRREDAEEPERADAVAPVGNIRALPPARRERLGGRSPADLHRGEDRLHAAAVGCRGTAQGRGLGRVEAMGAAGGGAAGASLGRARAGAKTAVHPAAAVLHGRLAATAAGAGMSAATGRGQEIAGTGAVPQMAAAGGRQAGGRGRKGAMEPMSSGESSDSGSGHSGLVVWKLSCRSS
jgi:hypothetical protein